ncbi:MAG: hypothetical protein ACXQS8_05410 [Candidatus Helarchaeales archaeon]
MIRNLWIILESGVSLFQKNFGDETKLDENLISGLFLALTNFAKSAGAGDLDSINLKKIKFIYQHAGEIIVVLGADPDDDSEAIKEQLDRISKEFLKRYQKDLENWDGELARFRAFSEFIDEWHATFKEQHEPKEIEEKDGIKEVSEELKVEEDIVESEAKDLFMEYPTETIEYPHDFKVFISKSLTEHYVIEIDFKNYPERPKIAFPPKLEKMLGPPHEALLTIGNWNRENPPKIVEVFRELESYIINYQRTP